MRPLLYLCLFNLLLFTLPVIAQQQYNTKAAYLVTYQNDTLRGFIKDRLKLNTELSFKTASASDFTTYTPTDIASFYVAENFYYETKEMSPGQKQFLLILAKGALNLYQNAEDETIFYLQKAQGGIVTLQKKDTLLRGGYQTDTKYRTLLASVMSDCKIPAQSISRVNFSSRDLSQLVNEYNKCVNPETTKVYKNSNKLRIEKGIKLGAISTKMKFIGENNVYARDEFSTNQGFSGGIFFKMFFFKEKIGVQPELLFTQRGGTLVRTVYFSLDEEETLTFDFNYLEIPVSVYYTFPVAGKIKPFVFAGGIAGYNISKDITVTRKSNANLKFPVDITKEELGVRGGTGVQWAIKSNLALKLEYLYERTLINKNAVEQKIRFTGHGLKLGLLF